MKKLAVQAFAKAGAGLLLCALLLFLSMPLILGSLWGFVLLLAYPAVLVPRILNEEKVLKEGLPGYEAYMQKVRWRTKRWSCRRRGCLCAPCGGAATARWRTPPQPTG